jgi:hypothetical protein
MRPVDGLRFNHAHRVVLRGQLDEALEPFSAHLEVEEYEEECGCGYEKKEGPDPDCKWCNGTGMTKITHNPQAMWDWWEFGGRWDGWVTDSAKDRRSDEFHAFRRNMRLVSSILQDKELKIPWGILTPDGEWESKGWQDDDRHSWDEKAKAILEDHRDCIALVVDCHN